MFAHVLCTNSIPNNNIFGCINVCPRPMYKFNSTQKYMSMYKLFFFSSFTFYFISFGERKKHQRKI